MEKNLKQTADAIVVEGVTVSYRSYRERPSTLKESILRFLRNPTHKHYSTFNALTDVSLNIPSGSVFGIIGSNGSGKSTLLKVISGVLTPTEGKVHHNGRIASLIELGAGFDPELNAIENIYLHSSLYGRSSREIEKRIPHILDFSELHEFANTPVKYYSSGMYARLGFSVAIDIEPDILLVDEILGVGDERFQSKCRGVFDRLIAEGKTIILVTHDPGLYEALVTEAILLSKGHLVFRGEPMAALEKYRAANYQTSLE